MLTRQTPVIRATGYHYGSLLMMLLFLLAGIGAAGGEEPSRMLSADEKVNVRDAIVAQHRRIENLDVELQKSSERGGQKFIRNYEWAVSAEKSYRSMSAEVVEGAVIPDARGVVVWDGHRLKAFDTGKKTGSVRGNYDRADGQLPQTSSPYSQLLGHFTLGRITELFDRVSLDNWEAEWTVPGKEVVFRSQSIHPGANGPTNSWTFDLQRGAMITQYRLYFPPKLDQPEITYIEVEADEAKEVKPGIWLPMKSRATANVYDKDGAIKLATHDQVTVRAIRLNDPNIESKFEFKFPEGSQYYDYVIGMNIDILSPEALAKSIDQQVVEVQTSRPTANDQTPNDVHTAQQVIHEGPAKFPPIADASSPGKGSNRRVLLWSGLTFALLATFVLGWQRHVKRSASSSQVKL